MSVSQNERAARFRALHAGPHAFIIPNPWDVGSARILAGLGFQALATSSAASASALGRRDHMLTRDESLAHARLIVEIYKSKWLRETEAQMAQELEQEYAGLLTPEAVRQFIADFLQKATS